MAISAEKKRKSYWPEANYHDRHISGDVTYYRLLQGKGRKCAIENPLLGNVLLKIH